MPIFVKNLIKMKFVDVKNDVAFRKIFGNEKKKVILISFLNAVLGLNGHDRIKDVTLLNPFQLPRIRGEKASIIDVKAIDNKGATFIIEMQVAEPEGLEQRILYYTSKDYAAQINSGDDYPLLRPVYFIGVLNFTYFSGTNYFSKHLIIDEETGECTFKDIQFRFIELTKFKKKADELVDIIDKWTFFIKNARKLEVIPSNTDDEGLREAYEAAAQHNWSKEEYDDYIYDGMREQDARGIISLAERRAAEKAVEKDRETERIRMIGVLSENSVPISIIAKTVDKTEAEVLEIIENKNK